MPIIRSRSDRERVRKWIAKYDTQYVETLIYPRDAARALCGPAPRPSKKRKAKK